jgi:hypothetical protein
LRRLILYYEPLQRLNVASNATALDVVCVAVDYWHADLQRDPLRPGEDVVVNGIGVVSVVWQADTRAMNPSVDEDVIEEAYAGDEAAAAEYGAQFRRDIESVVARETVEACIIPGRHEFPPMTDVTYTAFVDPSGGSQDAMILAIAHREDDHVVLGALRERRAPFSPEEVVREFAAVLKAYRCLTVTGDRFGGEWPRERFRVHGITYQLAPKPKNDLYRELLPLLNSGTTTLLDHPRLVGRTRSFARASGPAGPPRHGKSAGSSPAAAPSPRDAPTPTTPAARTLARACRRATCAST